jgi:hypothetical protein
MIAGGRALTLRLAKDSTCFPIAMLARVARQRHLGLRAFPFSRSATSFARNVARPSIGLTGTGRVSGN